MERGRAAAAFRPGKASINMSVERCVVRYHLLLGANTGTCVGCRGRTWKLYLTSAMNSLTLDTNTAQELISDTE